MFFSDKYRFLKILVLAAVIFTGCFYASWLGPQVDPDFRDVIADGDKIGQPLIVQYATVLFSVDKTARLANNEYEFTAVFPENPDLKPNQSVSVEGIISEIDQLEVAKYHAHTLRQFKYYFSLGAIFLVVYLLFKKYKFNLRRLIFTEK